MIRYIDARRVIRVEAEGIRKRCDDDLGIRRFVREDPGLDGNSLHRQ